MAVQLHETSISSEDQQRFQSALSRPLERWTPDKASQEADTILAKLSTTSSAPVSKSTVQGVILGAMETSEVHDFLGILAERSLKGDLWTQPEPKPAEQQPTHHLPLKRGVLSRLPRPRFFGRR